MSQQKKETWYSNERMNRALQHMRVKAVEMGLRQGVAFICAHPFFVDMPRVAFVVVSTLERDPDPNRCGDDKGENYFGIAMSKLAFMLSTKTNSGSQSRLTKDGEVNYHGGLAFFFQNIADEGGIYVGYSGGTEHQDMQIARKGLSIMVE
ncbi:hypothetical protein KKH23_01040 [Patescibacteria group bacterium]|nr:hypothetical protein [Patescibacteria group bacterium]MBU0777076.1 hypothetical protein [Patescibacteria group bacterium]MBU0845770.1 hypothetical protein [Patescibacteria group bacterium]MBU0922796.1 hypothetical protein [Patescibacteria group bacterium]MBU1066470.1 hypothetical protein [Patescibacteria group bacterium]